LNIVSDFLASPTAIMHGISSMIKRVIETGLKQQTRS